MKKAITLNDQTKLHIERATGMKYDEIISMDSDDLTKKIEHKIGKKLKFKPNNNSQLIGRGSVYLYLNRLFNFNTKKLDRYIDNINVK